MRRALVVLSALAGLLTASAGSYARCLSYEPARVTLEGTLVSRRLPGPPNYRSSAHGDYPETVHFLELDEPICVSGSSGSRTNSKSHSGIEEVQVNLGDLSPRGFLSERVRARGRLIGAHMPSHRTPVVLSVEELHLAPDGGKEEREPGD